MAIATGIVALTVVMIGGVALVFGERWERVVESYRTPRIVIEWSCGGMIDDMRCTFTGEAESEAAGHACVDVVLVCDDGEHVARSVCSRVLESGDVEVIAIPGFVPPATRIDSGRCDVAYRNGEVKFGPPGQ